MLMTALTFAAGLVLLYFGSNWLIDGSSSLAVAFGMKPITVGLTVVAVGTSSPELAVGVSSAITGKTAMTVGNLLGASILNLSLVLGVAALVRPIEIGTAAVRKESIALIGACVASGFFLLDGAVSFFEGTVLAALFLIHMTVSIVLARREAWSLDRHEFRKELPPSSNKLRDAGLVAVGLVLLIFGARWMVGAAVDIATAAGISEGVIALTVVSLGTTLPEMTSGIVASSRDQGDIVVGAVFGSCIFNLLAIMGITSMISGLEAPGIKVSIALLVGLSLLLFPFFRSEFRISKLEGGFLLLVYLGYVAWLALG